MPVLVCPIVPCAAAQDSPVDHAGAASVYTRISNNGKAAPEAAIPGDRARDWACTRDDASGLMWEIKSTDAEHLRYMNHIYTWFDSSSRDGSPGTPDGGYCARSKGCDTEKYTADVNATGLCGYNDWRLPTLSELQTIVDRRRTYPSIDSRWFPNTPPVLFWSSTPYEADAHDAWGVNFDRGVAFFTSRADIGRVRLVRTVRGRGR